jgi:hypothetical protein
VEQELLALAEHPSSQRGNQNPYIVEGQTTEWPKQTGTKGQITIYKTVHRKLKIEQYEYHYLLGDELGCSARARS